MQVDGIEGGGGPFPKPSRRMLSVSPNSALLASPLTTNTTNTTTCFLKDGRKINIGDCALFKIAQDSPTFVGIIRSFTSDSENNLLLGVKWLYRPAKVKLPKGVTLEAAPNEVFYSFLWDEIPAASLLHPCKVAFLPKGAELPTGAASFVCRRVYDITNKCLWWLSDQDFIDERQEEVDKLLHKTRLEMHALVEQQQGLRSPKPLNGSSAAPPPKHSPDFVQNSTSFLHSKTKGKKRDRGYQSSEINKRGRNGRGDDGDSCQLRSERFLNLEIAKVAERGGLVDPESVAKLVSLMQPDRSQRKIDLAGRCMLAGIIAATDKLDYLSQFIQLRGLVVLDEWLQEVHKGKIGNSGNINDSEKSVENFILVLLCALVKLPVNLNALQMCNIGKSVNYLRTHKNSEIQRKARSLVDTWKKRVEAEMTVNDVKSGRTQAVPSPGKSRDGFHGIGGHHSSMKSSSVKLAQGESKLKYGSAYQSITRSALSHVSTIINCKDGQARKLANGSSAVVHKETASNRSPLVEKTSHNASDALIHVGSVPEGNCHKLIVKIPNRAHGPAQNVGVVSTDDTSAALSERREKSNPSMRNPNASHKFDDDAVSSAAERTSDTSTLPDVSTATCVPDSNEMTIMKVQGSYSSFEALIESCVRLLGADVSMPPGGDVGMHLLASVAVGEFSDCGIVSPAVSPLKSSPTADKQLQGDITIQQEDVSAGAGVLSKINDGESAQHFSVAQEDLHQHEEDCLRDGGLSDEHNIIPCTTGMSVACASDKIFNGKGGDERIECCNQLPAPRESVASPVEAEDQVGSASHPTISGNDDDVKNNNGSMEPGSLTLKEHYPHLVDLHSESMVTDDDDVKNNNGSMEPGSLTLKKHNPHPVALHSESMVTDDMPFISSETGCHLVAVNVNTNVEKTASVELYDHAGDEDKKRLIQENGSSQILGRQEDPRAYCDGATMDTSCVDENLDNREASVQQSRNSSPQLCSAVVLTKDSDSVTKETKFDLKAKHQFDLNEGVNVDEGNHVEPESLPVGPCLAAACPASPLQVPVSSTPGCVVSSIIIAASSNRPFVPSNHLSSLKTEVGWKGSASTSAFRPAEPRKVAELPQFPNEVSGPEGGVPCKQERAPLDFDLNVADESFDQESDFKHNSSYKPAHGSGGLDFDLNKTEVPDMGQQLTSDSFRMEVSRSSIFSNGEASGKIDFDLNDGPAIEEMHVERTSYREPACNDNPLQSSFGSRFYNPDTGNVVSLNPPGTSYSVSVPPSAVTDRKAFPAVVGVGPHRVMNGPTSNLSFYPDMPFQPPPFQYPVFRFGSSFPPTSALASGPSGYIDPAASGRYSALPPQLVGNPAGVSFQYPYVVSRPISEVSNNGVFDRNQIWGKQGLDLNSGPGGVDFEGIDVSMPTVSRQVSAINSQPLVGEQALMYSMGGGVLKRKEPDGGSSMDKLNFKQPSWWR